MAVSDHVGSCSDRSRINVLDSCALVFRLACCEPRGATLGRGEGGRGGEGCFLFLVFWGTP